MRLAYAGTENEKLFKGLGVHLHHILTVTPFSEAFGILLSSESLKLSKASRMPLSQGSCLATVSWYGNPRTSPSTRTKSHASATTNSGRRTSSRARRSCTQASVGVKMGSWLQHAL